MEPDVIRMYSSSPPPMEDGAEEEEDEFGDFGGFSSGGVPNSISFTEFDTPTSFNQSQALAATSPPELLNNGGVVGRSSLASANGTRELSKVNGVVPGGVCQTDSPSERTVETKKVLSNATDLSGSGQTNVEIVDCNGTGGTEVLTNGFAALEVQGSPPLPKFVHSHKKGNSTEDVGALPPSSPEDNFADFAAFPGAEEHHVQAADTSGNLNNPRLEEDVCQEEHSNIEQGMTLEDDGRDINRTGSNASGSDSISFSAEAPDDPSNGDRGSHTDADSKQRDIAFAHEHATSEAVCTTEPVALNGVDGDDFQEEATCGGENGLSPGTAEDSEGGQLDGKGSGNETETETEITSFGRPLSTDALEEYGDMSTTGSVPSPPLPEDTATPADHSQLGEDDDEDFGDFGDAASFGSQGFADFDQLEPQEEKNDRINTPEPAEVMADEGADDDFGDFDTPKFHSEEPGEDGSTFADFPCSESFGNFTTAPDGVEDSGADAGWSAFDEPEPSEGGEQESWAAFGEEQPSAAAPLENKEEEWQESVTATPAFNKQTSRRDSHSALLSGRLERLFQSSFPETPVVHVGEDVTPLQALLEPSEGSSHPGQQEEEEERCSSSSGALQDVWRQLLDIHGAFGLRHQWGGSHSNKTLLCSLGIDIRNILFTGQKKHPVIVPMYAASLGMLEPTKEPVKPISAAEVIASIAQTPPVVPAKSSCPPDTAQQETLPPVQFDWSSSGLTNPLDASGGSSLLNLDFFGPVEDSGSTSTPSIPGVDPELYELTTAKLDPSGSSSRVADAFARLMSTMEKTSTSTRKPRKEENLSEEASKVIAGLPDLSFMQAKVLMFPTTLTPLGCTEPTPD